MDATVRESLHRGQFSKPCRLWGGVVLAVALAGVLPAAEPAAMRPAQARPGQARAAASSLSSTGRPTVTRADARVAARSPKVDHAVMPAGGAAPGQAKCSHCQRSACPQCRLAEGHTHGHSQCQHGLCPAHCPVRPDVFGYYGTRWRKWPGAGVVQASNNDAATPARPPRAEVPGAEEESLESDAATADLPAPAASDLPDEPENTRPEPQPPAPADPQSFLVPVRPDEGTASLDDASGDTSGAELATPMPSAEDTVQEDSAAEEVSRTAWRTFTNTPPRLAVQP